MTRSLSRNLSADVLLSAAGESSGNGFNASPAEQNSFDLHGEEYIIDKPYVQVIFICLYSLVFCFCFFGNLAVVLVVTLHRRMRSITKFCLGNLAFADLCVGIFCVFQNLSDFLMDRWIFGPFLCKMYHFINSLSHTASILILVVMCLERYLAILHPFKCRQIITMKNLRITIIAVWLISAVLSSPRLHYMQMFYLPARGADGKEMVQHANCAPQQNLYDTHIADMIYFLLLFVLPLTIISILYFRMGRFLWRGAAIHELEQQERHYSNSDNISVRSGTSSNGSPASKNRLTVLYKGTRLQRRYALRRKKIKSQNSKKCILEDEQFEEKTSVTIETSPKHARSNARATCAIPVEFNDGVFEEENQSQVTRNKSKDIYSRWREHILWRKEPRARNLKTILKLQRQRAKVTVNGNEESRTTINGNTNSKIVHSEALEREDSNTATPSPLNHHFQNYQSPLDSSLKNTPVIKKRRSPPMRSSNQLNLLNKRQAVVRMLIAIVITFAVCNLPFHLRKICQNYLPNYDYGSDFSFLLTPLTFLLQYTNCALNPILYAFMSKSFRASFKDLLQCKLGRELERQFSVTRGN